MRYQTIKIALCLGFLLVTSTVAAQFQSIKPEVFFGVNGGVTFSTIGFRPAILQKQRMGFTGGASFRYIAEWYAGLIIEANIAQSGWKEDFQQADTVGYDRALTYFEMPFLAHIYFGKKNTRFFINLGPKIAFLMGETENATFDVDNKGSIRNPLGQSAQYGKKADNMFDYGITGGVGMELRTKAGCFLVEGRYYFGLADIYNNKIADPFPASPNQQITAKLTYLFKMK